MRPTDIMLLIFEEILTPILDGGYTARRGRKLKRDRRVMRATVMFGARTIVSRALIGSKQHRVDGRAVVTHHPSHSSWPTIATLGDRLQVVVHIMDDASGHLGGQPDRGAVDRPSVQPLLSSRIRGRSCGHRQPGPVPRCGSVEAVDRSGQARRFLARGDRQRLSKRLS